METNTSNKSITAKEKIILSAESLFSKNGYQSTSVNTILSNAKVSKGAFYHHFKTKEDLILAIIEYEHNKIEVVPKFEIKSKTPEEIFESEITRWFQALESTKNLLPWIVPLMAHPVLKNKFKEWEPEVDKTKLYLEQLLRAINIENPKQESEILYYFYAGIKMELSINPQTTLENHKEIILNKYLKNKQQ